MAASSSSNSSETKYDVFLSFRGEDTRENFISHLYDALCRKKLKTFIDDDLKRGEEISLSLLKRIEESKVGLIVFSNKFASSKWCLNEVVKVIEYQKKMGLIVIPVFYHVDPSNVRNQTGEFGESFDELVKNFKDKGQEWRSALGQAGRLSGWDSSATRPESLLIEKIVSGILERLNLISSCDFKGLVGIDRRVEKVMSLLCIGLPEFRMVGIWGMGGIGKTTIADAIFNRIANQFESCYFLSNVKEVEQRGDLIRTRDDLMSKLLEDDNLQIGTPHLRSTFLKDRLRRTKVLIVLDDVHNSRQLETLLGGLDQFGQGSRVIVTTRNKQVLNSFSITETYDVECLLDPEAFRLFCKYAFGQDSPLESYTELSLKVLNYAQGNALALKVLASSLRNKSKEHWESDLNKLKKIPKLEILDVLKVSYDGLDEEEQDIFLDIACFFKREKMENVMRILDGCYHAPLSGINVLVDRSLVAISPHGDIEMHDLLQEMGWDIVRKESKKEPGKRSRLWTPEDAHHVLTKNTGTGKIEGIFLDLSEVKEINLNPKVFAKMHNLRFLKFYYGRFGTNHKVRLPRGLKSLPDELRYLSWPGYPSESLPSAFCPEKLVELNMSSSNVERLWRGTQNLINLKKLDLRNSKNLEEIPDLSRATNLVRLDLRDCESLIEVPLSIQHLNKLTHFDLGGCRNLESLPSNINLSSLTFLDMHGCSKITKFPDISRNIEDLYLNRTAIEEVPPSVGLLSRLVMLNMSDSRRLKYLPRTMQNLESLRDLKLRNCINITEFPEILCETGASYPGEEDSSSNRPFPALRDLDMFNCKRLKRLPANIWKLKSLHLINFDGTAIQELPSLADACNVDILYVSGCEARDPVPLFLPPLSGFHCLTSLHLKDLHILELPEDISCLYTLYTLDISGNNFQSIPASIKELSGLEELNLSFCKGLQSLPELPQSLAYLNVHDCASLETIFDGQRFFSIRGSGNYIFSNCFKLEKHTQSIIVENAQGSIEHLRDHDGDESTGIRQMVACLPGIDISEWFDYETTGSSVTIQMPPHWFNKDFRGFAFCLVISFNEHSSDWQDDIKCECHLESKDGESFDLHCRFRPWPNYGEKEKLLGSNHVFFLYHEALFYDEDEWSSWCWYQPSDWLTEVVSFKFSCRNERAKVESCGVRALYSPSAFDPLDSYDEDDELDDDLEEEEQYFEEEEEEEEDDDDDDDDVDGNSGCSDDDDDGSSDKNDDKEPCDEKEHRQDCGEEPESEEEETEPKAKRLKRTDSLDSAG